jgi:hypothetical protein
MRASGIYKLTAVVGITMITFGTGMVTAGAAWGLAAVQPRPVPIFHDARRVITLKLPPPPYCTPTVPNCLWELFVNEPKAPGQPTVAKVTGRSGVLSVDYPEYCGVIQADALFGPDPWRQRAWARWTIYNCDPPTTTSTTTTTTHPDRTTTTTTTRPPHVASSSTAVTETSTSALPFTAATDVSSSSTTPTVAATPTLPFTGANTKHLLFLGMALILLGGSLLTTMESRRRMLRRASALRVEQVKQGAGRASSWFLGL